MTSPSKDCCNLPHVHFMQAAARHQVNPVFHPGKGKKRIQIFHFHHLLDQKRKIGHVFFSGDRCDDHLDAVGKEYINRVPVDLRRQDLLGAAGKKGDPGAR